MIDGLKPYESMKDSGVPWLGRVPAHWEVRRLKNVARMNPSKSEAKAALLAGEQATFLPMERVGADGRLDSRELKNVADVWSGFTYFRRGDVLVAKITPCFENGKGACLEGLHTDIGFGSTEFHVLRAGEAITPQYLYRLTTLPDFRWLGTDAMTGAAGQQRVPERFVSGFAVPVPPKLEQEAITSFLSHFDRRVQRYVAAKKRLIALLVEQKRAIVHHAVTRGVDADVATRESGIEWLGTIPAHWTTPRLKHLFHEVDRRTTTGTEVLLSLRMLQGLVPHTDVSNVPIGANALVGYKHIQQGQVVMNRMRAAIGLFGVATQPGLVSPDYAVFQPASDADPEFFVLLFKTQAMGALFRLESTGLGTGSSGFMRLYSDRFGTIRVPCPPLAEQRRIVNYVEQETGRLARVISQLEQELSLVREFHKRIITDVATGKLDVREANTRLAEINCDLGEDDSIDEISGHESDEEELVEAIA